MTDAAAKHDQLVTDFAVTFKTDAGRRTLAHLVDICHVYSSCHVPNDPGSSAFQEGQRDTVVTILNMLKPLTEEDRLAMTENEEARRDFEDTYGTRAPV